MKRNLIVAIMLLGALSMSAREYQHSAGVIVGNSFGLSYKGYIRGSEHFVIETNLTTKLLAPGPYTLDFAAAASAGKYKANTGDIWGRGTNDFLIFEASPNFFYQAQAADLGIAVMNWYAGGGIGVGALWGTTDHFRTIEGFGKSLKTPAFKIDEHGVAGLEFCFKSLPLNLSVDFRPGLGEFIYVRAYSDSYVTTAAAMAGIFFDWTLGVALRYRIGQ